MHVGYKRAPFALILAATLAASYLGSGAIARADDGDENANDSGPPPAVARIAAVEGDVGVKHGDGGDQGAAAMNAPLLAGDYLTTGQDGRAEIQLDANTIVRAGAGTQLRFTQLDGQSDVAQIAQGSIELRVLQSDPDQVQVQTPSVDVEPSQAGAYLISVRPDGNTEVTARSGSLAVVTPQGTEQVDPGRTMLVEGTASSPHYQYEDEVALSDLEQWGDERDQQLLAADQQVPQQVANADIPGIDQLDQNGQWVDIPGYGNAWVPNNEAPNWTPYSTGAWVNEPYYGYTWVAAEPWGWAPYHYGRWAYAASYGWAWVPGAVYARPAWSPALVAFFGFGGGTHIGIGFGNVGWVPLAPGEAYHPWWGYGNHFSLNISYNSFRNYSHGYVGVSYNTWQRGGLVSVGGGIAVRGNYRLGGAYLQPRISSFAAIHPYGARSFGTRAYGSTTNAYQARGWQNFGAGRSSYARPSYAAPQRSYYNNYNNAGYGQRSYQQRSFQQNGYQQRSYQQRSYQQRSYPYQQRSYPYQQRSYQNYSRGYQGSYQQRYQQAPRQSYQARGNYSRSFSARTSGGERPHGPGRP